MKNYLLVYLVSILSFTLLHASPGGINGATKKTGTSGCSCHTSTITTTVLVSIQGPATLQPSQVGDYTVTISGGAGTAVGVDIAASAGTLQTSDGNLRILNNELTHPSKKVFSGGQYVFKFKLVAPANTGKITLFSTACSKKSQWNFASNFEVAVEAVSGVDEEIANANSFQLNQNYPNPFNPSTSISYQLSVFSKVILKVYDLLGNEVATLVNEEQQPGYYTVSFNHQQTANNQQLTSGVYFYQLKAGNQTYTRKMILTK